MNRLATLNMPVFPSMFDARYFWVVVSSDPPGCCRNSRAKANVSKMSVTAGLGGMAKPALLLRTRMTCCEVNESSLLVCRASADVLGSTDIVLAEN